MDIIETIFKAFEGPTKLAEAAGLPVQTVSSWKTKGNIPNWRRDVIVQAAKRAKHDLPPSALAYLCSHERLAPRTTPTPEQSAEGIAA